MKKIVLACALIALGSTQPTSSVVLTSGAIGKLDGTVINAKKIQLMFKILSNLEKILGHKNGSSKNDRYTFKQKKYSLRGLMRLLEDGSVTHAQLAQCFKQVKSDLKNNSLQYAEHTRGSKSFLILYVNESCLKHGHKESILLNWAHTKEGTEAEQMEKELTDLYTCYTFALSLSTFLQDMIQSCPSAVVDFKKFIRQKLPQASVQSFEKWINIIQSRPKHYATKRNTLGNR
ncbi:hypothetical protein HRU45_05005 [Candidatus Dependentiae bacterium]|nr:hypothetical protein [Candidatus Dependentiae bacterium]